METIRLRLAWSIAEIAEATGLSVNFLRLEIKRGNLRTVRFGRRLLVRKEDLEQYISAGSCGNSAPQQNEESIN